MYLLLYNLHRCTFKKKLNFSVTQIQFHPSTHSYLLTVITPFLLYCVILVNTLQDYKTIVKCNWKLLRLSNERAYNFTILQTFPASSTPNFKVKLMSIDLRDLSSSSTGNCFYLEDCQLLDFVEGSSSPFGFFALTIRNLDIFTLATNF